MIRLANKFDFDAIKSLLIDFFNDSRHPLAEEIDKWSATHVDNILTKIIAGLGFVLIDDDGQGLIVAVKHESLWVPKVFVLQEAMWYAKNKTTGVKLIKEYISIAEGMKERGEIKQFYFNAYRDADFHRYNARKISTCWGSYG